MRNKLIVLSTILGLVFLVTGTVSYFSSVVNGTINGTTDQVILNVTGFDDEVNKTLSFGKIKPGDEGEFTLNLNMTGSGMDVIYTVDIERINLPDNLKFYYDDVHISPFANCSKFIEYNASSMTDTVTVYWYWDPEIDSAKDSLFINTSISASISVSIEEQVYGTMKNGYYSETGFWSDTYRPYLRTIEFESGTSEVPSTCDVANLCWDISASDSQEYHVYAYMIDSGFKNTNASYTLDAPLYDLYIACDREIYAPSNCSYLFRDMKNLININFNDNFNTGKTTNMHDMFRGCTNLVDLNVSGFNTISVLSMDSMFAYCSSLTSLDLSGFNTKNVDGSPSGAGTRSGIQKCCFYSMFSGCSSLTSLDLSNFNTVNAVDMSHMFDYCSSLTSLDLSSFNTSKVTDMEHMFYDCSSLTSLDLSSFNTSKVTKMSWMFTYCSSLTSLDLSNFNTHNVISISDMFIYCSSLTSLDVSSFNTSKVTNMTSMFSGCSSLTSLDVSSFNTSNVTSMQGVFRNCSSLTSLDVSNFNTSSVTNMVSMFYNCSSLTSLDVSNFNTSSVTGMVSMFEKCSSLTSLDLSGFNTISVLSMDSMFAYCSSLTSLDVSNFNTSSVTNMASMFIYCSSLTSLDISNFDFSSVTDIANFYYDGAYLMFGNCPKLSTTINMNGASIVNYSSMFSNAATDASALITVNYTTETSTLVDNMIATKSANSNVVKGSLIS